MNLIFTIVSLNLNLERSFHMLINQVKRPFQYEKIPIEDLATDKTSESEKARNTTGTIRRIWTYLSKEKVKLTFVVLMVLISSSLSLLGPYMVGRAIDQYIDLKQITGLATLLIWLVFIYFSNSLAIFLQNFWMIEISQNTVYTLRAELFHQFHRLSISYFDKNQHGELMSRVTNDIDNINNTLNQSVIQIFSSILTLVGTVTVMLILSPLLTVITMTIIPVMFLAMRWITKRTGPLYKLQQNDLGDLNGYVEETVSGQHIIKTFSREQQVINEFEGKNNHLLKTSFWAMLFSGYIPKVMNMLNFLSFGLIALFGGVLAINGVITVGVIVIFTEYARQFTRPLNELSNQFNILLSAVAGAERVFSVLDEPLEEDDEKTALDIGETKGELIFRDVSFSYEDAVTLNQVSFQANPGQTVAFVGHTGAGKTTIINLIARFYNYDTGEILLDGIDIKKIKRSSLRKQMAFVLQDAFLFNGTIRENIRYGRLDATDHEVISAAKKANAHEFINRLRDGYNTVLDQDGSGISQGEKQLLTIARAMIAEPNLLILDEATSNIDTITEIKIQEALQTLMHNRTSFVIAHRLNTIQTADKIIILEDGEIREQGSHDQLIRLRGKYYDLNKAQLQKETNY